MYDWQKCDKMRMFAMLICYEEKEILDHLLICQGLSESWKKLKHLMIKFLSDFMTRHKLDISSSSVSTIIHRSKSFKSAINQLSISHQLVINWLLDW